MWMSANVYLMVYKSVESLTTGLCSGLKQALCSSFSQNPKERFLAIFPLLPTWHRLKFQWKSPRKYKKHWVSLTLICFQFRCPLLRSFGKLKILNVCLWSDFVKLKCISAILFSMHMAFDIQCPANVTLIRLFSCTFFG